MRYALLADIHANLPALEAVLAHLDGDRPFDGVFHLGDLVGYAPWPNETVALLRDRAISGVAGNYDSTVATDYAHCGCRYEDPVQEELSHISYAWTRAHVLPETKQFLGALPFRIDIRPFGGHIAGPTVFLVHGAPTLNTLYWTEDRPDAFCAKMGARLGATEGDIVAFGHTHIPWAREVDGVRFVNAGSVGRPKDGDWRAAYVVLRLDRHETRASDGPAANWQVEIRRVEYDLARAMDGIRNSELPDAFADFLERGGARIGAAGKP